MSEVRDGITELYPHLLRFAVHLTHNRPNAEDLLHAAIERALLHEYQFTPETCLKSWLFRIIQTVHLDDCRSKAVHRRHCEKQLPSLQQPCQLERVLLDEISDTLYEMRADFRNVFIADIILQESQKETSLRLSIPQGTAASRLNRAKAEITKKFL